MVVKRKFALLELKKTISPINIQLKPLKKMIEDMRNYIAIKKVFFLCTFFVYWGCGKNVKYLEETDITRQVNLQEISCNKENFFLVLEKISVLNTVQDSFVVRSHTPLGLNLRLKAVNQKSQPEEIKINNDDFKTPYFVWTVETTGKSDTIGFLNKKNKGKYLVGPNDSLEINLQTIYFNFYKLLGDQQDYSESMQNLLSNFSLSYIQGKKGVCIEQNSTTKVTISNHKSQWEWW